MRDLQELEQRWGLAAQNAGFGVWDLDVRNHTVHYSPQWKAMLGYGADDRAESTDVWRSRVHPDDLNSMLDALTRHLSGVHPSYEKEFRLQAEDGSYRWVLSRGRVVERDEGGKALRAVGTLTDLTDRRQAERLRVERDRAEAASLAKTEFLSRMSHELRTPLNAVLGFAQLLSTRLGGKALDEQRRFVANIEQAGWELLRLIDGVLDLSRIETGKLDVQIEPVLLTPLLQAAADQVGPKALQNAVLLRCVALPPDAAVRADAARLRQVLDHLLGNAVKYNRPGGTVIVTLAAADDAWTLSVADTGAGIPAEHLQHLFEPFNRLGRNGSGDDRVGLGLALARPLVEAMGGQLSVSSTEGVGSTFSVTLPAAAP